MCGVCRGRAGNMPMVPPPYVCTACQQVLPIQDVARHLARCEPSGRELDLVARESVRRLVAERSGFCNWKTCCPRSTTGLSQAMGCQ